MVSAAPNLGENSKSGESLLIKALLAESPSPPRLPFSIPVAFPDDT